MGAAPLLVLLWLEELAAVAAELECAVVFAAELSVFEVDAVDESVDWDDSEDGVDELCFSVEVVEEVALAVDAPRSRPAVIVTGCKPRAEPLRVEVWIIEVDSVAEFACRVLVHTATLALVMTQPISKMLQGISIAQ